MRKTNTDDVYYNFIKSGIMTIDENFVDSKDISKHKNDIYRLISHLSAEMQIVVPEEIYNDMQLFIKAVSDDNINFKHLGIRSMTKASVIESLQAVYIKQKYIDK